MQRTKTTIGAIAILTFLLPIYSAAQIQKVAGKQQEQQIELDYESSLAGAPADSDNCEGGALSGSMGCVAEMMDGTTGGSEETSRAALAAIPVTPKVASGSMGKGVDRKVLITLLTRTGDIAAISSFPPADQAKLRRDLFLAKHRLDNWSLQLTEDQAKMLLDDELPIKVSINDGWDQLSLLKPTQTQITIMPAGSGMTPEQVAAEQRENRTVDVSMNVLPTYDNEYLRLITNNFGEIPATGLTFEFEHNGPMCPYRGGCDEASGYPEKAEYCSSGSSSQPQECMACQRDVQAAKDSKKARYVCPNAELEAGGRAELKLNLKFNAEGEVIEDNDDAVIDAEPFSECKEWPTLSVIVSSKEKDNKPDNNKDSVLTPGFGPNITGLKFKIQPQDDIYARRPNPAAKATTEAEHLDTVYLEAQLDGAHCGFEEKNKNRPAGFALVKAGSERYDVQMPLYAASKGVTVLRSDLIKLGEVLERLGDSQSVPVPNSPGARVYTFPFDINAEAERNTAKLTVHGAQKDFPRAISVSIVPETPDAMYYDYPSETPLAPGEEFSIQIKYDDVKELPGPRIEFQHLRGTTLIGKDTLRLNRGFETANTAIAGTFNSENLEVGPNLTKTEFYPGDTLVAVFNEADNGKKERAKSLSDRKELGAPTIKVKSVELNAGSDENRRVSTDGTFEALVTFSSKPANEPGLVELRLTRNGKVVDERIATMSWRNRGEGIANAIVNIAKDKPFSSVNVGDRIEARYGSGKWAEFPEAALAVVGSPGKLESLKILSGGEEVTEFSVGSTVVVEAIYETAPKDRYSTSKIDIETGIDYTGRPPKLQNRLVDVDYDRENPQRFVSGEIDLLGSSDEYKYRYGADRFQVAPGYKFEASLANMVATGNVIAGEQPEDKARVTITAFDVDGRPEDVKASFMKDRKIFDTLTHRATDIPAGSYDFRVDLDVIYFGEVTYEAGQKATIEVPKQDRGRLIVELVGADGKPRTPGRITYIPTGPLPSGWSHGSFADNVTTVDIPHGTYNVRVGSKGWSKLFTGVQIEAGKERRLKAGGGRGTLEFSILDVDKKKLQRGFSIGGVSGLSSKGTVDVEAGTHTIETRDTFPSRINNVSIVAGEKREKTLQLGRLAITGIDPTSGKPGPVKVKVSQLAFGVHAVKTWSGDSANLDVPEGTYAVTFVDVDERQTVTVTPGKTTPVTQRTQAGYLSVEVSEAGKLQETFYETWECRIYRDGRLVRHVFSCQRFGEAAVLLLTVGDYFLDVRDPARTISQQIDFTIKPNETTPILVGN